MIKAIETTYKGYRFRSRLEARWGVFFDGLGVKWQYEPEGFELPDGTWYLPDFYINAQGLYAPGAHGYGPWLEVKGTEPSAAEVEKLRQLCESHCSYGLLVYGSVDEAKVIHIHKEGFFAGVTHPIEMLDWLGYPRDSDFDETIRRFELAIAKAKTARFEHGQSGALA